MSDTHDTFGPLCALWFPHHEGMEIRRYPCTRPQAHEGPHWNVEIRGATQRHQVPGEGESAETRIQARPGPVGGRLRQPCGPLCNCPPGTHQRAAHWPPPEEGETFVTKNGKVLTAADIQQLADEAEKGYDVTHLKTDPEPVYCGHRAPVDDCAGCAPVPGTVLRAKPRGDLACAGCPSIILEGVRHMVTAEGTHYHLGCYASMRWHQERGLPFPPARGLRDGKALERAAAGEEER